MFLLNKIYGGLGCYEKTPLIKNVSADYTIGHTTVLHSWVGMLPRSIKIPTTHTHSLFGKMDMANSECGAINWA